MNVFQTYLKSANLYCQELQKNVYVIIVVVLIKGSALRERERERVVMET